MKEEILQTILDDFFIDPSLVIKLKTELETAIKAIEYELFKHHAGTMIFGLFYILDVITKELNSLATISSDQECVDAFKTIFKMYYLKSKKLEELQESINTILNLSSCQPKSVGFYALNTFNLALIKVLKQTKTLSNKKRLELQHSQAF
jgi:hypothetical protein